MHQDPALAEVDIPNIKVTPSSTNFKEHKR